MNSSNHGNGFAMAFDPYLENQDKVALVAQLEAIYVRPDAASSFIRRPDPRRVTGWEQGIFYLPSRDMLLDLLHDEMHVKWMGDMSKKFVTKMFEPRSGSWDSPLLDAVKSRDIATCVITGKQYTVAPASLIPPGFEAHMMPPMIFDDETTYRLTRLVKSFADLASPLEELLVHSSVSTLTLDWEMHNLFAEGWVGFRPVEITEHTTTTTTTTTYYVEFAVHWLYPTVAKPNASRKASLAPLRSMFSLSQRGRDNMHRIKEHDSEGRRIRCGTIARVPFTSRERAQDMMDLLALRWAASLVLFYAGGVGRLASVGPVEEPAYRNGAATTTTTATATTTLQPQHQAEDEFEAYDSGMDADDKSGEIFRRSSTAHDWRRVVTPRSRLEAWGIPVGIGRAGRELEITSAFLIRETA